MDCIQGRIVSTRGVWGPTSLPLSPMLVCRFELISQATGTSQLLAVAPRCLQAMCYTCRVKRLRTCLLQFSVIGNGYQDGRNKSKTMLKVFLQPSPQVFKISACIGQHDVTPRTPDLSRCLRRHSINIIRTGSITGCTLAYNVSETLLRFYCVVQATLKLVVPEICCAEA